MHCSSLFTENKFQFIIFVEPKNTMYSDLKKVQSDMAWYFHFLKCLNSNLQSFKFWAPWSLSSKSLLSWLFAFYKKWGKNLGCTLQESMAYPNRYFGSHKAEVTVKVFWLIDGLFSWHLHTRMCASSFPFDRAHFTRWMIIFLLRY
jgi:hypothetical protein